jgi:hypothetical protein
MELLTVVILLSILYLVFSIKSDLSNKLSELEHNILNRIRVLVLAIALFYLDKHCCSHRPTFGLNI